MESDDQHSLAPPVVAVVVVHSAGPWFDETLAGLARQDYPNLETLFVLAGGTDDADGEPVADRILARLPDAFIRDLGVNPGFGPAANAVLDVVEGDNGFFCICHDDVALDPDAIRLLIEELYRSNAGIIGPKLVTWDNPNVLQDVGLDVDAYGQAASRVEPGEYDQEQLDAVTDVFAVPSACLLTSCRPVPVARRVRPVDELPRRGRRPVLAGPHQRRPGDGGTGGARPAPPGPRGTPARPQSRRVAGAPPRALDADAHVGARLPLRLLELAGVTLVELVLGLFTGRLGEGWASTRALVGAIPRSPTLLARRGAVAKVRSVGDSEIRDLQSHGSNALRLFGRGPSRACSSASRTTSARGASARSCPWSRGDWWSWRYLSPAGRS